MPASLFRAVRDRLWPRPAPPPPAPPADPLDNSPRSRRIIQAVSDFRRGRLEGCRILDLGSAHGLYTLEFARRGASTLGIEGRAEWLLQANADGQKHGIANAEFQQGDARDLSVDRYGRFDVVLCLGLLYHLDAPACFDLLQQVHDVCTDFAVIDTQIALRPDATRVWRGHEYHGWVYQEHDPASPADARMANLGASLDNTQSFWLSRWSLLNALRHVGFTSVAEVLNPMDNMYVGGEFRLHADVVTLVAMKGIPVGAFLRMNPEHPDPEDWPEDPARFFMQRPWSAPPAS